MVNLHFCSGYALYYYSRWTTVGHALGGFTGKVFHCDTTHFSFAVIISFFCLGWHQIGFLHLIFRFLVCHVRSEVFLSHGTARLKRYIPSHIIFSSRFYNTISLSLYCVYLCHILLHVMYISLGSAPTWQLKRELGSIVPQMGLSSDLDCNLSSATAHMQYPPENTKAR